MFMLYEIPFLLGSVLLGRAFCLASPLLLGKIGIPEERLEVGNHPLTNEPGCWLMPGDWHIAQEKDLVLWTDPFQFQFVTAHLEAFLVRNASQFLGIQEVETLLREAENVDEMLAARLKSMLENQQPRHRFARLLHALLKENVPITRWQIILRHVSERVLQEEDIHVALREARLLITDQLPGIQPSAQRLWLPEPVEERIAERVRFQDGKAYLAIPPEETQELLAKIRPLVDSSITDQVLVARNPEIRLFIRRLVEIEFPKLMVLSKEELLVVGPAEE